MQKVKFFVKLFFKKVCRCGQRPQNNIVLLKPWGLWSTLRFGRCKTNVHWTFCTLKLLPTFEKVGQNF